MIYMKHKEHGNAHFDEAEQAQREAAGWVRWPRTREQKSGIAVTQTDVPVAQVIPDTRETLLAAAAAEGLKVDRRWSDARLRAELKKG